MSPSRSPAARLRRALTTAGRAAPPSPAASEPDSDELLPDTLVVLLTASESTGAQHGPTVVLDELGDAHTRSWRAVEIRSGSLAELRRATPWLAHAGETTCLRVLIRRTDRPRSLHLPATVGGRAVAAARLERSPLRLELTMAKPTPVAAMVRAMLTAGPAAGRPHPAAGLRLAVADPHSLSWAGGDPAVLAVQDAGRADGYDLLLGNDAPGLPPVDIATCSPHGFVPAGAEVAELRAVPGALELRATDGTTVQLDPLVGVTENHVRSLRSARALRVEDVAAEAAGIGRILAQLCCAGVPILASRLPAGIADDLGADLVQRLEILDEATVEDALERESWSVTTRRMALARFAPAGYWAARGGPAPPTAVSVLLATRRTALLPFALAQAARQDWPNLEIVVVLHGVPANDAVRAAVAACPRPIEVVEVGADVVFGRALDLGLARCSGLLVTKMDDDDWYGPHHVTDLVQAHAHSGATLVGCTGYHVYLQNADVTMRWSKAPTEAHATWLHGGTMLLATADLHSLGAWPAVPVGEDAHLLRAVRTAGGSIYGIHDLGFCYYRGRDHTWDPETGEARWLDTAVARLPGFVPPPQLDPLPHPWVSGP